MKKINALLLYAVLFLSACTGPAATQPPTTVATVPPVEVATEQPTAVPTSAPTPAPVTLRFSSWGNPSQNEPTTAMVNAFMAKYPYITVEMEFDPFGAYWEKKTTQLASNSLPDVFGMSTSYICDYAGNGRLLDLSQTTANPEVASWIEGLPQAAFENLRIGGKLWGFPYAAGTAVLYYNKNLFDAAGVAYPSDGWTYDDMLAAAAKMTLDTNGDGSLDQWGFDSDITGGDTFFAMIHSFGGRFLSDDGKKSLANSHNTVEALQFIQDLIYKYKVTPRPEDMEGVEDPFGSGMIAMRLSITAHIGGLQEITDFAWDIAAPPLGFQGELSAGALRGNPNFVVSAISEHPQEAALLAAWMSGTDAQTILGAAKGRFPVHPTGQGLWLSAPPEHYSIIIDLMKNDVKNEPLCYNHSADIGELWVRVLEGDILTNAKRADEVAPDLAAQIQAFLDTP
jgi:multiple sugar transport system substrate-binding protein